MRIRFALLLTFIALPALAHPGHGAKTVGLFAGFAHPFSGFDHLLAMLAVGMWSATTTRRVWLAPLCFAATLLVGALLTTQGLALPAVEPMIAASVLLLGLFVMVQVRLPEFISATLVAAFALFHGAAHGSELGFGNALAGMVIATALLHAIGIVTGLWLKERHPWWQRTLGVGIALSGFGIALNML